MVQKIGLVTPTRRLATPPTSKVTKMTLSDVSISYGTILGVLEVVKDLSLDVYDPEFLCLVGISGCGKSTLLNVIAGLQQLASGQILLDGQAVSKPGADRAMVFQDDSVFPWYTVRQNIEYGLKIAKLPPSETKERVDRFLKLIGLVEFQGRYPRELSGGMRKRVDVARAMVTSPKIILMDEPFASLDVMTREKMQVDLLDFWSANRTTVVFVTHDLEEALFLSDRIAVMSTKPGYVRHIVEVPFSRPRNQELKTLSQFQDLRRQLAHELHRI